MVIADVHSNLRHRDVVILLMVNDSRDADLPDYIHLGFLLRRFPECEDDIPPILQYFGSISTPDNREQFPTGNTVVSAACNNQ
jgi:hypothetical protein